MVSQDALSAMAASMAHRGPDGEGFFVDPQARIGLAHRRLAIIDPTSAAAQPMPSCGGRYQVVFNGEIYNFRELARELTERGYSFNQNSDTAVLAPLYDLYGEKFLNRLNGIFCLALWDAEKRELLVARDAEGVKPLYYVISRNGFAFASEIKALVPLLTDASLDAQALVGYLSNLWSAGEATPFKQVRKLPPGHLIRCRPSSAAEISRWHERLRPGEVRDKRGPRALAAAVASAFNEAVNRQCISDVPIGAFLSGGVDSSAIVAAMVASGHAPHRTYCIRVDGASMKSEGFGDDAEHAQLFAQRVGVRLTTVAVREPTPEQIASLPVVLDEPTADLSALYVAAISQAARAEGIKVLLGGTGGDDIFSGYRRHRAAMLRERFGVLGLAAGLSRFSTPRLLAAGPVGRRLARLGYMFSGTDEEFLLRAFEFNPLAEAMSCLAPEVSAAAEAAGPDWLTKRLRETQGYALPDRMLDLEMQGFLPDHNLNYNDKAAMANGVEVRVPFLDKDLVALAAGIPWQLKLHGFSDKWIFKTAMAGRLPASILKRKKTGFGAPVRVWVRKPPMRDLVADTISAQSFRERGLFAPKRVQQLFVDTMAGRRDGAYLLLAVVVLEHWLRSFVDRGCSAAARRQVVV
jgi:asparagine synthase (glutamine-hydrolysing)